MAAPITINKSNYYVTGGMYALGNDKKLKKMLGKDGFQQLFDFVTRELITYLKKWPHYKQNKWLMRFSNKPTKKSLIKVLKYEKDFKVEKGKYFITELSAIAFFDILYRIETGEEFSKIMSENEWMNVLYKFYKKEMSDEAEKIQFTFDPTWLKVGKEFCDVPILIKGYEYFLNHENEMSNSKLYFYIEDEVIEKILNVSTEYKKYKKFFNKMEISLDTTLTNKFKITYLKLCSEPLLSK